MIAFESFAAAHHDDPIGLHHRHPRLRREMLLDSFHGPTLDGRNVVREFELYGDRFVRKGTDGSKSDAEFGFHHMNGATLGKEDFGSVGCGDDEYGSGSGFGCGSVAGVGGSAGVDLSGRTSMRRGINDGRMRCESSLSSRCCCDLNHRRRDAQVFRVAFSFTVFTNESRS